MPYSLNSLNITWFFITNKNYIIYLYLYIYYIIFIILQDVILHLLLVYSLPLGWENRRYLPVILGLKKIELLLDALQCIGNGKFDWALRWWSLHTFQLEMNMRWGTKHN